VAARDFVALRAIPPLAGGSVLAVSFCFGVGGLVVGESGEEVARDELRAARVDGVSGGEMHDAGRFIQPDGNP
jgi:hypothetical protein